MFAPNDGESLLGFRLLVHPGNPGFEAPLQFVDAEPAIFIGVRLHPLGWVAVAFAKGQTDLLDLVAELAHQPARFPLGLSSHIAVDPEASDASGHNSERLLVFTGMDEFPGVCEESSFLETELCRCC